MSHRTGLLSNLLRQLQGDEPSLIPQCTTLSKSFSMLAPILQTFLKFNTCAADVTLFWKQDWGRGIMQHRFPKLFQIAQAGENVSLKQVCDDPANAIINSTPAHLLPSALQFEWHQLQTEIAATIPNIQNQTTLHPVGILPHQSFSSQLYTFLSAFPRIPSPHCYIWSLKLHPRVAIFMWKLLNNKLPTYDNLRKIGWCIPNYCVMCKSNEETTEHLFSSCNFFSEMCHRNPTPTNTQTHYVCLPLINLMPLQKTSHLSKTIQFTAIAYYCIWKERCRRIFDDKQCTVLDLVRTIQTEWKEWKFTLQAGTPPYTRNKE